ncbi:acyl-CoA desaturase [Calycomorphotria hydatis]|uniref:Fatty acid desaturase n=1 Tax=Calycomorphotria hydatis TaxID=2528027 RepID=A0A517TBN5_9PLAN|nr:fatty acid desaturase [Calycomorphotria hydatis]QDT65785.1 Fatty acid desaturase [Calycomorphotria hydatis]
MERPALIWLLFVHLGALPAPFFFTWSAALTMLALCWVTGGLGICLGYHRLLTHGSFETTTGIRRFLAWCGMMAGEGPPIMWVAAHRKHHQYSDEPEDPHTPQEGFWWSHVVWMLPKHPSSEWAKTYNKYAPDLLRDPFMRFLNKTFLWWQLGAAATLFLVGWLSADLSFGASLLFYGFFLRLVCVLHGTWLINSATHMWGYRNYETTDHSKNLWWVALLTYGEGWHNNHHAYQRAAQHGHRWWEIDVTWMTIRALQAVGLAWNVVPIPTEKDKAGRKAKKAA